MTDWHKPSTATALHNYLTEASVYVWQQVLQETVMSGVCHKVQLLSDGLNFPVAFTTHQHTQTSPAPFYQSFISWTGPSLYVFFYFYFYLIVSLQY